MSAKITNYKESDNTLTFTLSGVDVCFANGIRRTILADIPTVVFKTIPFEKNNSVIIENTSRLNNEIIKQRLSCIPIHIKNLDIPLESYLLEVNETNITDTMMIVTTENFKIKNVTNGKYLEEKDLRSIFPPYIPPTGKGEYYIDFVRLRPKISDEIPGEKINLTCKFSIGTAREDSMFNVSGTCSYGFTPDPEVMKTELQKKQQLWRDEGKPTEEIDYESKNWSLLDGLRFVKKNSFDFILETLGVFDNDELVAKACDILIEKFSFLNKQIAEDDLKIAVSETTIENCYDVTLENEDYTIGNILNHILYDTLYRGAKYLSYVGFKKMHPHDSDSIIRIAFTNPTHNQSKVKEVLKLSGEQAIKTFRQIKQLFVSKK